MADAILLPDLLSWCECLEREYPDGASQNTLEALVEVAYNHGFVAGQVSREAELDELRAHLKALDEALPLEDPSREGALEDRAMMLIKDGYPAIGRQLVAYALAQRQWQAEHPEPEP